MNLKDALDELQGNILRDRSDLKTGPDDSFWSSRQLIGYINEAQKRFARRSYCLRDDTTPLVTQVKLRDGAMQYVLHASVFFVVSARVAGNAFDMKRIAHSQYVTDTNEFFFDSAVVPSSAPVAFSTDEGIALERGHSIEFNVYPTPDATVDGTLINLRVVREPLYAFSSVDLQKEFEIPEAYQLDMLEWAAWRSLRNWDIDAEDRKKAKEHRDRFDEAVAEARSEAMRKAFTPVTWLFGQGGFSYGSGRGV